MASLVNSKSVDDVEACTSDQELMAERGSIQHYSSRGRIATGIVGVVALFACGLLVFSSSFSSKGVSSGILTVRTLFENPELHEVATANIVNAGSAKRTEAVRRLVDDRFHKAVEEISRLNPEVVQVPVTDEQKDAILHVLRYISDARLQSIGVKVAHAIRDAGSEDPEVLKRHIAHKLAPRMVEMKSLHAEMLTPSVRELLGINGGGFEHLLNPKMIRLLKTMDDNWDARLAPKDETAKARLLQAATTGGWGAVTAAPAAAAAPAPAGTFGSGIGGDTQIDPIDKAEEGLGIAAGVGEEVSVLLRIIKPLTKMFGKDINLPPQATSAIGAFDALTSIASCETKAAEDKNPLEVVGCIASSGSAGFDALREIFTLTGLLGDNNPANGEQGNHNGADKVHMGVFND